MTSDKLNRVPHIIFLYWVIKIASTTLGETGADMLSMTLGLGYAQTVCVYMLFFLVFLAIKIASKGYHPITYWLVFTTSALVGTGISDYIDRTLGLGYAYGSTLLTAALLLVLALWRRKEKSVSVDRITKPSAEIFYWIAFLLANTLGTAAGDYVSDDLGLGFLRGTFLLSGLLAITALLYRFTKISRSWLFWWAFVLTRPLGANLGDFLTKSHTQGGLDLGTMGSSVFFCAVLVVAVAQETRMENARRSDAA